MPIPHVFEPGTVAASSEVNENNDFLLNIIGVDSEANRMSPEGDILLGPRKAVQITADGDTGGGAAAGYVHIGWNAELYDTGASVYKVRRFVEGEHGMALRVGNSGVSMVGTGKTDGDLEERFELAFRAHPHDETPWIYVNEGWRLQNADAEPALGHVGTFRTTLVMLDPPVEIMAQDANFSKATNDYDVRTLPPGTIPRNAVALLVHAWVRAPDNASFAEVQFRPMGDGVAADYMRSGFKIRASRGSTVETQGICRVGRVGNYEGMVSVIVDFEKRAGKGVPALSSVPAGAWVQGYWV